MWAAAALGCLIGVLAHGVQSAALTLIHLVGGTVFTAVIAAYTTAWWFVLHLQCSLAQAAYQGCDPDACPCLADGTCSGGDLTTPVCAACMAPRAEACAPVLENGAVTYILALNGLVIALASTPALCADVIVLLAAAARRGGSAARLAALRVGVEQQARLILAGDKPTVTPGTLKDWVAELLLRGDAGARAVAQGCRKALRARGYELPVPAEVAGSGSGGSSGSGGNGGRKKEGIFEYVPRSSGGPEDLDAAERGARSGGGSRGGGRPPRRQQVTPVETPASAGGISIEPSYSTFNLRG